MTPAYIPIAQLVRSYTGNRERLIVLNLYLDEAGDSRDMTIVGMGGCVASLDGWASFEEQWKTRILRNYGIDVFHMTDFDGYYNEFSRERGWDKSRHEDCLNEVIDIVSRTIYRGICVLEQLKGPRVFNESMFFSDPVDPYYNAFYGCVYSVLEELFDTEELLHIFVSRRHGFIGRVGQLFDRMIDTSTIAREHLAGLTIAPRSDIEKRILPFQAADVIWFELWKEAERVHDGCKRSMRYPLCQLLERMPDRLNITMLKKLILGPKT